MAMQIGKSGGEPDVMVEINTTPLIDVMLVLLIMLIITIPIQLHAVNLDMPGSNPPPPVVKPEVVRIDVDAANAVRWNGEALAGTAELDARLQGAAAQTVQPEVHIRPDRGAAYQTVAAVLAAVQRHGLNKIGLAGAEQFI